MSAQELEAAYNEAQARLDGLREALNTLYSLYSDQEQARDIARDRWGAALRAEGVPA